MNAKPEEINISKDVRAEFLEEVERFRNEVMREACVICRDDGRSFLTVGDLDLAVREYCIDRHSPT